jgi:AcrR family transcriptional regulator
MSGWDARRERIQRQYERVALEMFAERGFHDVTMDDIAARLGVSARTLFRYFPTKEDILLGMSRRSVWELEEALVDLEPTGDPLHDIWNVFRELAMRNAEDLDLVTLWQRATEGAPASTARVLGEEHFAVDNLLARIYAEGMGIDSDDVQAAMVAAAIHAASLAVLRHWHQHGSQGDLAQLYDSAWTSWEGTLARRVESHRG